MSAISQLLLQSIIFIYIFNYFQSIRAQSNDHCQLQSDQSTCSQCKEGYKLNEAGNCTPVCIFSTQYYSFEKKDCVYVCEVGYQENKLTSLCEKLLQCPENLCAGQTSHIYPIDGISVYQDQWIVSFSIDKFIIWKIDNSRIKMINNSSEQQSSIFHVQFSSDGKYFYSFSRKQVLIWSIEDCYKIDEINLGSNADLYFKKNMVKYTEDDQSGRIDQLIAFTESFNLFAVILIDQTMLYDGAMHSIFIEKYKNIPQREDIKTIEMISQQRVFALTNQGNLLFWDTNQDNPIIIFEKIVVFNLSFKLSLSQGQDIISGLFLELLTDIKLTIVKAEEISSEIISYRQPYEGDIPLVDFQQYAINKFLNEVYLVDSFDIYIYNLQTTKFILKHTHNIIFALDPITIQIYNKGKYIILGLNNKSMILERTDTGIQQSQPTQFFDNQFTTVAVLQANKKIKISENELIWIPQNDEIIAQKIVKAVESSSLVDVYSLKNIAHQRIVAPKQEVKPQAIVYFEDYYAISFPQSIYIWSYRDHTLLYTIDFQSEGNNKLLAIDKNKLFVYRDLSCSLLSFLCWSNMQLYEIGNNYANRLSIIDGLNTDYLTTNFYYYKNNVYIITSPGKLYQFIVNEQFLFVDSKIYKASNTTATFKNVTTHFTQNLLLNVFKNVGLFELRDINLPDQQSIQFQVYQSVGIQNYLHSNYQNTFTVNLVNSTLFILQYNSSGFQVIGSRDNIEEQVILSAYNMKLQRLILVQGYQILTIDMIKKITQSKQWAPIYYQVAEKEVFITSKDLELFAFMINRQILIFFDMITLRIIHYQEFQRINQLSFMKFDYNKNIMHFAWENKTHSYTQFQNPYQKTLFQSTAQFEEMNFPLIDQQQFNVDKVFFDQNLGVLVKVDYHSKIMVFLDIILEQVILVSYITFEFQNCIFIPKKEMIIFQNSITNKLYTLYYRQNSTPIETSYTVDKSLIDFLYQNDIQIFLTYDQNYLIYAYKYDLVQLDVNTMQIAGQQNLEEYLSSVISIEKTQHQNVIQIRGYLIADVDYFIYQQYLLLYNTIDKTIQKFPIYQDFLHIIVNYQANTKDEFIGVTSTEITINSLSKNLQTFSFSIQDVLSIKVEPLYLVVISSFSGVILNLEDYSVIDKWVDEEDIVQKALYIHDLFLVIKKKQSSIYVSEAYTGKVKFLLPIQINLIDFFYLEKKQIIILQLPTKLDFIDLKLSRSKQSIFYSSLNTQLIYMEQGNSFLMIEKNSNQITILSYDSENAERWKPASSNQKQVLMQSDFSVFMSDDDFQVWKFENFEYFQTNVYKSTGPVQHLLQFQDKLIIISDKILQIYNHQTSLLLSTFPIFLDELPKYYRFNNQEYLFFVGKQTIRQLVYNQVSMDFSLIFRLNSFELANKQAQITRFTYSQLNQKMIISDSLGNIYIDKLIKLQLQLSSSEIIFKLKYLEKIDCLLISTNLQIALQDFSDKRSPKLITTTFNQTIYDVKVYDDSQILLILDRKSIKLQIIEVQDTSITNQKLISIQKIKSFMNPTYFKCQTRGEILGPQNFVLYSDYYLNIFDNKNDRFIIQIPTSNQINRIYYQQNILFISTNSTLLIIQLKEYNDSIVREQFPKEIAAFFSIKQLPVSQSIILSMKLTFYDDYFYMDAIIKDPDGIQSIKFNIKNDGSSTTTQTLFMPGQLNSRKDFFQFQQGLQNFCYTAVSSDQKLYQINKSISITRKIIDYYSSINDNTIQIIYKIGQPLPYILSYFSDDKYQIKFIPSEKNVIDISFFNFYLSTKLSLIGFKILLKSDQNIYPIQSSVKTVVFDDISLERQYTTEEQLLNYPQLQLFGQDSIIFNNIRIHNQQIGNEYFLNFQNASSLVLKNITISNSTLTNVTLFNIYNIEIVIIKNLVFIDNNMIDFSSFFLIQDVKFLQIMNITIKNTKQIEGYYSIRDLYDYKLNQNLLCLNLVNILGAQYTVIDQGLVENNENSQFLSYINSYDKMYQIITLKYECIIMSNLNVTNNFNTESYLSVIDVQSANFKITNSTFSKNYCPLCYRGTNLIIYNTVYATMINVEMSDNLGLMGGALYIQSTNVIEISGCRFYRNSALSYGGAIYFDNLDKILFSNTFIEQNNADIGGGIYYNSFYNKQFQGVVVQNNIAFIYGQNIGSFPNKIIIKSQNSSTTNLQNNNLNRNLFEVSINENERVESQSKDQYQQNTTQSGEEFYEQIDIQNNVNATVSITNFRSGDLLSLSIKMLDEEGKEIYLQKDKKYYNEQSIKLLSTFYIMAIPESTNSVKISGANQISIESTSAQDKQWHLNDTKIIGHPNQVQKKFRIIMGQIKQYDMYNYLENKKFLITDFPSYELLVTIDFRSCIRGEIYNCDEDSQFCTCTPCPQGQYSLQVFNDSHSRQVCELCPDSAFLCQKDQIFLKKGYWRISNSTDQIIQCTNMPSNCQGDTETEQFSGNFICVKGHIGPLCEVCDSYGQHWGEPYMRQNNFKCIACKDLNNFVSVLPFLLIFLVMVFYIIFSIRVTIQLSKGYIYSYYFRKLGMIHIGTSITKNQAQFYIKQFMHYLQISVIINSHDFDVPYVTDYLPQLVSSPIRNTVYSFDCVFGSIGEQIPIVYLRSAWSLIIPFYYMITIGVIYLSIYIMKKSKRHNRFFIYNGLLFMLVLFQPGLVSNLFQVISCRQIGGKYYISAEIAYECYTREYYEYILILILPGIILWGILIPIFILLNIKKNRGRLDEYEMRLKFGFLYVDYNQKYFYWEFIKIYEKVIIMVVSNMFDELFYTKQIIICAIIVSYLVFCIKKQPYLVKNCNTIDQKITISIFILILLNMFLHSRENDVLYEILYYICVLLHNSILFFLLFKFLITKIKTRYRTFLYKLLVHLKQILPLLFSFIKLQPPINSIRSSANWRKVQIAKNIIIKQSQNGNHITSIEQLRKPYQNYIQEIQYNLINVINSNRTHKTISDQGISSPSHQKLKKQTENGVPSPQSTRALPRLNKNISNDKKVRLSKANIISQSNSPYRSSINNSQNPSTDTNNQFNQVQFRSSDISPTLPFSLESPTNIIQLQSQNPFSVSKIEDNINSQTKLQKHKSSVTSQFLTPGLQKGKDSIQSSNQLSILQNSMCGNSLQKSIYQYSAQNLQEESNFLLFNSGANLSPSKFKDNDNLNQYPSVIRQSPSKLNTPRSEDISIKGQNKVFMTMSSSSGEESCLSYTSQSSSNIKSNMESGIDEFIKEQSPLSLKSKTLNNIIINKLEEIEMQPNLQSPKTMSSPHFKYFLSQPSLGQGTVNLELQDSINQASNFQKRESKQLPYKFTTQASQMRQNRQDSLFSFQTQDIFSAQQLNGRLSSQSQLSLQKQNSPQKFQSQSTFKFNNDHQIEEIVNSIENFKNLQTEEENQNKNFNKQNMNNNINESIKSLPNQPYQSYQAKNNVNSYKKLQSLQQIKNQANSEIDVKQNEKNNQFEETVQSKVLNNIDQDLDELVIS